MQQVREAGSVRWRNWAGTATARPADVRRPGNAGEIAAAVTEAGERGLTVRALGSGHSFTDAAVTDGIALELSGHRGIVRVDGTEVTVRAGTTLRALNAELDARGLALSNLGDIDAQTVAGAISTGTHGTGAGFGGLATQVTALELITADGGTRRCSATEEPELFAAARVSLGALGVLSEVTLRCEPAFALAAREYPARTEAVLDEFDALAAGHEHVEFYWFPYSPNALVKVNNRLPAGASPRPLSPVRRYVEYELLENTAFGALCRVGRAVPALARPLGRLAGAVLSERSYSDTSHRVVTTSRRVRFVESEYAVPRAALGDVLRELRARVPQLRTPVLFPVEVRAAAADDVWLSTAYGRDTAYVAVHQYVGMPYAEYFALFASIADAVGGRPHWGKLHALDAAALRERYPRFAEFTALRDALDPDRRFANPYLTRVLG